MNKSASFILPTLKLPFTDLTDNGLINTYMGYVEDGCTKYVENGEYILLSFIPAKMSKSMDKKLKRHERFEDTFKVNHKVFYVFNMPEDALVSAFYFTLGKYSKFTEEFLENYYDTEASLFLRKICMKHDDLYEEWEKKGVSIPTNQEVWEAPDMMEEIYHSNNHGVCYSNYQPMLTPSLAA